MSTPDWPLPSALPPSPEPGQEMVDGSISHPSAQTIGKSGKYPARVEAPCKSRRTEDSIRWNRPTGSTCTTGKSFKPARGIWRIPIEGGEEAEVVSSLFGWCNFSVTQRGIYFISSSPRSVEFLTFSSGRIKTVFANEELGIGLDLSPDGRYLLYTTGKRMGSDLMLVE